MEAQEGEAAPDIVAFAGRCTLHGIGHVFLVGPLTPRRVAWGAAVLAALGIVLYQVADRIQYYAGYDHVTALDKGEGRRLTFPAVSFCNVNRIRRSRLTPNDLHWVGRELLGVELSDYPEYSRALGWPDPEAARAFPSRTFNLREFVDRTSHDLEDMLLECRFGNRPCGARNFSTVSVSCFCSGTTPWLQCHTPPSCSGLSVRRLELLCPLFSHGEPAPGTLPGPKVHDKSLREPGVSQKRENS